MYYSWDPEKNAKLKRERCVSFEDVIFHIGAGDEVALLGHLNHARYSSQKIAVILVKRYAYLVPFVETPDEIFLKTIIPSRTSSKQYIGDPNEEA